MLNCNKDLPKDQVNNHINQLMLRMQYSGYDRKFRTEVTKSALNAYKKIIEKEERKEQPIHRPKAWKRTERAEEKRKKKENWYKKGKGKENEYESIIFVPATPKAELRKKYEREVENSKLKIKIIETSGKTLKQQLQRSDPFKKERCGDERCLVCTTEGKGPCRSRGATYEIICPECQATYIGETARSTFVRGIEHKKSLDKKDKTSVLWRHAKEEHESRIPAYKMNVTGVFGDDAMKRQIMEAIKIKNTENVINEKGEFYEPLLPSAKTFHNVLPTNQNNKDGRRGRDDDSSPQRTQPRDARRSDPP